MRPARVRLAAVIAAAAVVAAILGERIPSERLLGLAFGTVAILLGIAAVTILRRVVLIAGDVDFRTILGAISVFTLLGLLFAFLYVFFSHWTHASFFTGVAHARASDYVSSATPPSPRPATATSSRPERSASPSPSSRCSSARSSSSHSSPGS